MCAQSHSGMFTGSQWHIPACVAARNLRPRGSLASTRLFRKDDMHMLRDMPVHRNRPSEGVFLHTRTHECLHLWPRLRHCCAGVCGGGGGGARGTVLQITAHSRTSSLLEQVSKG